MNNAGSVLSAVMSSVSCFSFVAFKAFVAPGRPAPISATVRYMALAYLTCEVAMTAR